MASTRITVLQDQENVIHQQGKANLGVSRIPPKPFVQDNVHQATPRRALGDVRNIQLQRPNVPQKNILHSEKKASTSHGLQNHKTSSATPGKISSFLRPSGTAKKANKNVIKILEDEYVEKPTAKAGESSCKQKTTFSQDNLKKEVSFPFIDSDIEFDLPNYLADLSKAKFPESIWWPSFSNALRNSKTVSSFENDMSKLEIEDLPLHADVDHTVAKDFETELLDVSPDLGTLTPSLRSCLELDDIEKELALIDANCPLSQYEAIVRELESFETCCQSKDKNTVATKEKP